jgi:hypothetical protein
MSWRQKFTNNLRALNFYFCSNSKHSNGINEFVKKNYWDLKTLNPMFYFNIRECDDLEPYIIAQYGNFKI